MPRIQQLPPGVITRIAAGEVIERPASVVKELLENAIDAGSTRIDLEVAEGGIDLIRVVDDGCGILPEDLPLAFASHATSKLQRADDLFQIGTLGFRGEALASIGSIAQVALQSRPADQPFGAEITCNGGELSPVRAWNGSPGTRIEVRHLFYNTPVRRKFLRTVSTELGHISEVFTRLALPPAAPHLTLTHSGKLLHEVPFSIDLLDRIALLVGQDLQERLYPVEAEDGPVKLSGYIADPACDRSSAQGQYWYVNGRWLRDRGLSQALQDAYRGLLMTGRYPVAFLFLELPPDQVDVNVHPAKAEVRVRDPQGVRELVLGAARGALKANNLTGRLRAPASAWQPESAQAIAAPVGGADSKAALRSRPDRQPELPLPPARPPDRPAPSAQTPARRLEVELTGRPPQAIQVHELYLAVEVPEGLLVIDQHALHERVLFEQLKDRHASGTLEVQRLLIPEPVEFTPRQAALALEYREALAELGLQVGAFGGSTLLLSSYPSILNKRVPADILRAVVNYLASREKTPDREQLLNDLLSLMACHAAVRAGDRLTSEEIAALLEQRELARDSHHCPHGRPTSLLFTMAELNKQFRRT
jgi:DNA mismatch repair protein MutL